MAYLASDLVSLLGVTRCGRMARAAAITTASDLTSLLALVRGGLTGQALTAELARRHALDQGPGVRPVTRLVDTAEGYCIWVELWCLVVDGVASSPRMLRRTLKALIAMVERGMVGLGGGGDGDAPWVLLGNGHQTDLVIFQFANLGHYWHLHEDGTGWHHPCQLNRDSIPFDTPREGLDLLEEYLDEARVA